MGVGQLEGQARLAHARLAHDRNHLTASLPGLVDRAAELLDLGVATHKGREPARGGGLEPRAHGADPGELVDLDGAGQALHGHGPERGHLHEALGERQGLRGQERRARIGELLHARGEVGSLADRGVVHVQVGADRTHDDLARIEAHANADPDAVLGPYALRISRDRLLHPQRRVARADRVVLVSEGRAEERHDAVAHDLIDGALVAVHGFHHPLEHGIEDLARLLGIAVGEQLHRALEIGKQHRHLLALAFERSPGSEDPLGEVLRRIRVRRGELRGRGHQERRGALTAELVLGRIGGATGRTGGGQRCGALPTELHAGGILVVAPGTLHAAGTSKWGRRARFLCVLARDSNPPGGRWLAHIGREGGAAPENLGPRCRLVERPMTAGPLRRG